MVGFSSICNKSWHITCSTLNKFVWQIMTDSLAECMHHIKYRLSTTCAQVVCNATNMWFLLEFLQCSNVPFGKIYNIDIITISYQSFEKQE